VGLSTVTSWPPSGNLCPLAQTSNYATGLLVCVIKAALVYRPSKTTKQRIMHLENIDCRLEGY